MTHLATLDESKTTSATAVFSILKSNEFRQAYHQAMNLADKTPASQQAAARKITEAYLTLEELSPNTPLNPGSFYFAEEPVDVTGRYKFLLPGTIKRGLVAGPLFLLTRKVASAERLVEAKKFNDAIAAVEAVRLTLIPERVNGIVSFISDAKKFYASHDAAAAEKAMGTALDHLNRAAADGLRKIKSDAERGKRANEVAGTRRTLADLRKKPQTELTVRAEPKPSGERQLHMLDSQRDAARGQVVVSGRAAGLDQSLNISVGLESAATI
jgi:hypothetical protein